MVVCIVPSAMFETSDTSPIEGVELGDFVRARARLEHAPDDMAAVVTMLELPDAEAWRRVDQTWRARLETDKRLARVVDEFVEDHVRELRGDADDGQDGEAETHASREAPSAPLVQQVPSYMQPGVAAPAPAPLPPAPVVAPRVSPGWWRADRTHDRRHLDGRRASLARGGDPADPASSSRRSRCAHSRGRDPPSASYSDAVVPRRVATRAGSLTRQREFLSSGPR